MAISVRNHGMGPSSSNVDDIESCKTLAGKIHEVLKLWQSKDLRNPSFWSLHSKEGDHGHGAVVVVEGLAIPHSHVDLRGCWVVQGEDEVLAPGRGDITTGLHSNTRGSENFKLSQSKDLLNLLALLSGALGLVVAEEELPVEQLDADHSKDEQEEDVDDEDIEDIFEGNHDAVEDGLEGRHPVDHLERTQHTQ